MSLSLPRLAYVLVAAVAFGLMLRLNWPGHFSVDSVLGLHEGRFGVRETWNPAIFGWLLGVLDRVYPGGALVAALDGLLLFGAWAAMAFLRPRVSWLAPVAAAGLFALPQALIYPAIVWKDVLFAAASVAGFVVLAFGARGRFERPLPTLATAALLFAAAGLFRQNGLILAVFAALAVLMVTWPTGVRRALALAVGWLVGVAALTLALSVVAQPTGIGPPDTAGGKGVRMLQTYDLVGAAALQRDRAMPRIDAVRPMLDDRIRADAPKLYTPVRADPMVGDRAFGLEMKALPQAVLSAEWLDLVARDSGLYLRLRGDAFRWVFASPEVDKCLPVHLGITGPPKTLEDLRMAPRLDARDGRLFNYVTWFLDTPAMSHVAYAVLALVAALALLVRREPADLVMAALMLGALAFTASFFVISIACDYRYLYALDVAAITGVLYLALDPRLRRRA